MIVRDKPDVWDLLTALRGSIVPRITLPVLLLTAIATAVVAPERHAHILPRLDGTAFTVFGIGLSLFLGFRNNAAYDRWWEARKLWGGLLADLRSLARETEVFVADPPLRHQILRGALVYLHAHRINLRRLSPQAKGQEPVASAPHPPCAALDRVNALVAEAHRSGQVDGFGARALTGRLASMALQQAGCERVANSPLPFVYSLLIYRTSYLYCLLLPLALTSSTGWMTPVLVAVVAYMFLGLAEVTEELSHPFASSPNGIALDAICRAAEISLAPHLGETAPEALAPVNHYLS
ncbi:bestrophin family ion channel [Xinfangfangia sp. CPCC 101601]|uniref:Bestrophin family ion channel n=1 Tax=Pseudogemmobacter lacusdianii TaxID=3069608 RepID=A0ABU0VYY5_9RHOB|nr:bestrophin family ion channel [Xinfangfangia sp. CPCC 101601]MDQ2066120.1 bestrophin family ion channel [Xinfangfangia sp. CPCC 101601]